MQAVSADFLAAINADRRQTFCRVTVDYSDPFLDTSITVTVNESNRLTQNDHVANGKEIIPVRYMSLDGSWTLDNTSFPPPNTTPALRVTEFGWRGSLLSSEDKTFSTSPVLTIQFSARPIRGLKVVGDHGAQEWPEDFTVILYAVGNVVLHTETVTGNTGYRWEIPITPVNNVVKMTLTITKWSAPHRAVKIAEFFTSIQEIYDGDEIIEVRLLEEREISSGGLPVGNITANEIDVKLDNSDHVFDAGNIESRLHGLIRPNRRIRLEMGVKLPNGTIEWVPKGTYWTGDWDVPDEDIYAAVSARDRLELLRRDTYSNSKVIANPDDSAWSRNSSADWNAGTLTSLKVVTGDLSLNLVG
jgi:hypothetical protein